MLARLAPDTFCVHARREYLYEAFGLLVGLGLPKPYAQSVVGFDDVGQAQLDQLQTTERSGKAEQD